MVFQTDENGVVPLYKSYQNTQVSTILSPTVLERVLDKPEIRETKWYREKGGSWLRSALPPVQRLREALIARPIPDTELISVTMSAPDAGDAQLIVNSVVDQYLELVRESFDKTDRNRFQALTEQLREIQADIDSAIATNQAASRSLGTSEPEELRSQLTTQLSTLEAELRAMERQRSLWEWELNRVNESAGKGETSDDVNALAELQFGQDAEWRRLRGLAEAAKHRWELAKERLGDSHPKLREAFSEWEYAERQVEDRETMLQTGPTGSGEGGASTIPGQMLLQHQFARAQRHEELLKQQIAAQRAEVTRASELAQQLASSNEKIKRKRELYDAINTRLQELDVERNAPGRISIGAYALRPALPSQDRRILYTVMICFGAMAAGAFLAYGRQHLDPSVHRADQVATAARVPFLGQIPKMKSEKELYEGGSELLLENLRMIRTALLERVSEIRGATVLITSPTPETGKTTLTMLLGRSLASLGKKVLLIDADLRRPALAARLGHRGKKGIVELVRDRNTNCVVKSVSKNVDLLPAGTINTDEETEFLADESFAKHVNELRSQYDIILIDSPPVLSVADARILCGWVDGVLLLVRAAHTRRGEAGEALSQLNAAQGRLLGSVLMAAEQHPSSYGYRGAYGYGYSRKPETTALVKV